MNITPQQLLQDTKSIALVGISVKEDRPSNRVAKYLIDAGYELFFVNPQYT